MAQARMPGTFEQGEVIDAVMARTIGAGNSCSVEAEHHRQTVEGNVVDDLIPRPR